MPFRCSQLLRHSDINSHSTLYEYCNQCRSALLNKLIVDVLNHYLNIEAVSSEQCLTWPSKIPSQPLLFNQDEWDVTGRKYLMYMYAKYRDSAHDAVVIQFFTIRPKMYQPLDVSCKCSSRPYVTKLLAVPDGHLETNIKHMESSKRCEILMNKHMCKRIMLVQRTGLCTTWRIQTIPQRQTLWIQGYTGLETKQRRNSSKE